MGVRSMKEYRLLIWLTQLGLSVALPLAGFTLLGVWLHTAKGWGVWVIIAGLVLGLICAVQGFRDSLKAMDLMSGRKRQKEEPPVSFNYHD